MIKDRVIQKRIKGKVLAMAMTAVMASFFVPLRAEAVNYTHEIDKLKSSELEITADGCKDGCGGHEIIGAQTGQNFRIRVISGTHNITLNGVTVSAANGASGLSVEGSAKVNLTVLGENSLTGGDAGAGIYVPKGAELRITKESTGTLKATGGKSGAGIGGNGDVGVAGKITIEGGTIIAKGGSLAAGIGGNAYAGADAITINGGDITAVGGEDPDSPGIGYGGGVRDTNVDCKVVINGGKVKALGGGGDKDTEAVGIYCKVLTSDGPEKSGVILANNGVTALERTGYNGFEWDVGSITKENDGTFTVTEGKSCFVYGKAVLPEKDPNNPFKLEVGQTMTIVGGTLTIPDSYSGEKWLYYGNIEGSGTILHADRMSGIGTMVDPSKITLSVSITDEYVRADNGTYNGKDQTAKLLEVKKEVPLGPGSSIVYKVEPEQNYTREITVKRKGQSAVKVDKIEDAGEYVITYSKDGKPYATKTLTVAQLSLGECKISPISDQIYTGEEITPEVKVEYNGDFINVRSGTDYAVIYKDNINAGTATVTVNGDAGVGGNFKDQLEGKFTISPASLMDVATIELNTKSEIYNGKPKDPRAVVKKKVTDDLLGVDVDYEEKRSPNDASGLTNAGTVTITVTGKGNYEGTVELPFVIERRPLKVANATAVGREYDGTDKVSITNIEFDQSLDFVLGHTKDDLNINYADLKGIISSSDVGDYSTITFADVPLGAEGEIGANYRLSGTDTCPLTDAIKITQRKAPVLSVGGNYAVDMASEAKNTFVHTVEIKGATPEDILDPKSKVIVWMDADEDKPAADARTVEATWEQVSEEPELWAHVARFDGIKPGETHSFFAYADQTKNVAKSDVGRDVDRVFTSLPRTEQPQPGTLAINPEPNEDGETFTATITPPDGDEGPFLYSFDGENWQESNIKVDCLSGTEYTAYIKYAATDVYQENAEGTPGNTEVAGILQANKPEITTSAGGTTFGGKTNVNITYPTKVNMQGVKIYYTIDGGTPNKNSQLYERPFTIDKTTTVKAIATRENMKDSDMAEELFTAEEAIEVADGKVQSLTDNTIPSTLMGVQLDPDSPPISNAESIRTYMNAYLRTMNSGYEFDNVAYYDLEVEMRIYDKNGKQVDSVPAGENDFPRKIDLTYDNLRSADPKFPDLNGETKYDLVAVHMYSGKFDKFKAGEMENITKIDQVEGDHLSFTVNGTSPLAIGWKVATNTNPDDPNNPDNPDDPNNPDNPDDPNNPDNPDDPNNPDDPTNPDDPNNPDNPDPNANGDGTGNQNGDGTNGNGTTSSTNAAEQGASDDSKSALSNLMPKTGDPISFIPWIAAAVVSIGVIVGIVKKKKGKKKKPNKTTKKTTQKSTQKTKKKK